jgi:hypothetical protein
MRITECGLYQMEESRSFRGPISIETWTKGMVFKVDQISSNGKVMGPHFPDWVYPEIPCKPVKAMTKTEEEIWNKMPL